jgi:hypothetical protein
MNFPALRTGVLLPAAHMEEKHMKHTMFTLALLALTTLGASAQNAATKDRDRILRVAPAVFVDKTGTVCGTPSASNGGQVQSSWSRQIGLPQTAATARWGLFLEKALPTADCSAALANIKGVTAAHPLRLTELGFDVDSNAPGDHPLHCGAGAPRFDVTLTTGETFFFGCAAGAAHGTPFTVGAGAPWSRIRFTDADAAPASAGSVWPGFGVARVSNIQIVFDEGVDVGAGQTILDNIDINTLLLGSPSARELEDAQDTP